MKLLDDYLEIQQKIYDYFEYKDGWSAYPIDDCREYYWAVEGQHTVHYADSEQELKDQEGMYYMNSIFDHHQPTGIFRRPDFTMVLMDTQCDGNKFCAIFNSKKEININELEEFREKEEK